MQSQLTTHRLSRTVAPLLAAVLVLAGCGGSGDSAEAPEPSGSSGSGNVLAAEDLFVGAPDIVADAGGKSATLIVTTKDKVACKVVFGKDESVSEGSASDTDMADGPHTTHKAVMTDLEPGTEYFYRVEGDGAEGQRYESKIATFRTAAASSLKAPGENVAKGAEVTKFSSEFSDTFGAANAIDGDPASEWSSKGDGDKASITIDLGKVVELVGVGFRTRSMADGTAIINTFTVTGDDGKVHGPYSLGRGLTVIDLKLKTRTLRFDAVKTTGGNTGAVEIEAYAAGKAKES